MASIVITTIQGPTASVLGMEAMASRHGMRLVVVGDRKTPGAAWPELADFIGIDAQKTGGHALGALLPENHYARKNIGYLEAMARGSASIYDTDDDNAPLETWKARALSTQARLCEATGWVNAYRWFSDEQVWPRGLPLDHARHADAAAASSSLQTVEAPIQQGLANGSPDVDAIWRLVMDREITFQDKASVLLPQGAWCPFNSQSTWWFPPAYPLMYLPSFVSFRMTDIWRSFIAQRCLWALGHGVVFHGPEVFQDRNFHNLMRDFEQEVPGYVGNERFRQTLEALSLEPGAANVGANLHRCYEALVGAGLIPGTEMPLVECWLSDLKGVGCA